MTWKKIFGKTGRYNYIFGAILVTDLKIPGFVPGFRKGSIQWRLKQTQDGSIKFVSGRIKPTHYYGFTFDLNCFLDLQLNDARKVRDGLARMIKAAESGATANR
jgi:hypothetical protein